MRDTRVGSLLAAVFEDEAAARAGAGILRELHAAGTLTLYAVAIIVRRPRSTTLAVLEPVGRGAGTAAPAVGAAIGALVTLLGAPLAAASRTATSGLVGAVRDLDEAGFDAAFLDRISRRFRAGGAVIAEAEEEQQLALDARLLAQGGQVFRHRLLGTLTEERVTRELTALRCELRRLRMQPGSDRHTDAEARARQERVSEFQRLLERTQARARALRSEAAAKVAVLRAQASQLEGAARQTVEQRATSVRSGLEARAARLDRVAEEVALP
jgi:hypothetical protein